MRQRPKRVFLNDKLADWSAAYLTMWKALESRDPNADRWSEPADFGTLEQRRQAAEEAIIRALRHGSDAETDRDLQTFREELSRPAPNSQFLERLRQRGAFLADESVTAAHTAEL